MTAIITNFQFPEGAKLAAKTAKYPFESLSVGDGFMVSYEKASSARSSLSRFLKANKTVEIEMAKDADDNHYFRRTV